MLRGSSSLEKLNMIRESLVLSSRGCELSQALLSRVVQLRDTLDEIERSLQEKHLTCCVFPQLQSVGEVAAAIYQLSARRIGALIAVEREMSIEDYTKSGTLLNAQLSASLLLSLFYPGNPLHDGAVIIRRDRFWQRAAFYPYPPITRPSNSEAWARDTVRELD